MSVIADSKKNWLEQVKADAETITRERLQRELPKLEKVAQQIEEHSAPDIVKAKKASK